MQVKSKGRALDGIVVERHLGSEAPPYARPIFIKKEEIAVQEEKTIEDLMKKLSKDSIENHKLRQKKTVNLIPSEQTPSTLVRLLTIMDPSGRYAEHKIVEALGENRHTLLSRNRIHNKSRRASEKRINKISRLFTSRAESYKRTTGKQDSIQRISRLQKPA